MSTARKAARDRARKQAFEEKQRIAKHKCGVEGCSRKAEVEYICIACEKLEKPEPFVEYGCGKHAEWAMGSTKRHALKKHPVNLLRAVGAGLAGEEVF